MAYKVSLYIQDNMPIFEFDERAGAFPFGFGASGRMLDSAIFPTSARQKNKARPRDVLALPGSNAVSQRFRELVERFEPGVHQFFPITLRRKDDTPFGGQYFIFNVTQSVNALLTTHSKGEWYMKEPDKPPVFFTTAVKTWALSRPAIGQHHLWVDNGGNTVFCSEAFHVSFEKSKMRGLHFDYCHELDVPWVEAEQFAPILAWRAKQASLGGQ